MSAYAALVSLRQILVRIVCPPRIIHNIAELHYLFREAGFLKSFLDDSSICKSSQISALEIKMRDIALKAEGLFEYAILDSNSRFWHGSGKLLFLYILYSFLLQLFTTRTYAQVVPVTIHDLVPEVVLCTMNALIFYLHFRAMYVFLALDDSQELRGILYDFHVIVKDVIHFQRARGDPEMSAHVALISLRQILDPILDSAGLRNRAHLKSLHEMVCFLLDFLGNASNYTSTQKSALQNLDATIKDAAHKAKKALIEIQFPEKFRLESDSSIYYRHAVLLMIIRFLHYLLNCACSVQEIIPFCFGILREVSMAFASYIGSTMVVLKVLRAQYNSKAPENKDLPHAIHDFSIVIRDVIKIKKACGNPSDLPAAAASSRQDLGGSGKDVVVGLDSDLIQIKARLLQHSSKREVASIVGMGGIGKTTFAGQVYKDPAILNHFDIHAWVIVSQEYSLCHVLLCLVDSAQMLTDERREDNDEELAVYLHKTLMCRRYLIVMDDVWDTEIWDSISIYFPENYNGSRVLLTSRLPNVASQLDSSSHLYQMRSLSDNDSWDLLCRKVFGEEGCPLELESIGREIAQSCRGLPLAIVVIGGLLYKEFRTQVWRDVAENLKKSELQHMKEHCLEILGLSYNHLPYHLRPCFLYVGVVLGDCEIPISRLINLWVAEGFVEQCACRSYTLEEMAEYYVQQLVDRNLILVGKRSCNGKIRTCSMHDLLRDVCVQNARKKNFLHVVEPAEECVTREWPNESPRRLSIRPDALQINVTHDLMSSCDNVRLVLCIASKLIENPMVIFSGFPYLRVLDVLQVHFGEFPHQIIKLHLLRYLAFHYDGSLPRSILKLRDLETIIHHCSYRNYPLLSMVIWNMPNLRHLYVKPGCYLLNALSYPSLPLSLPLLVNLQRLVGIRNFQWSERIIAKIPNLKKLGISFKVSSSVDWSTYQLETPVYLHRLESLKIIITYDDIGPTISRDPPKLAFPQKLKKLTLSGCRVSWESMTSIGALPNLEALKLRCRAVSGPSWETVEGEFPQLIFLLLQDLCFTRWETDEAHFPRLKCLVIRSCGMLKEIPCAIGEIATLEMIELVNCHPSVVASVQQIEKDQEEMGNEVLKFHIQGRRGADEMNLDARGVFPGLMQVLSDAIQTAGNDFLLVISWLFVLCIQS